VDHDVIIVGAGPAGLSTGLHLAQLAPALAERTLILERAHHPRPKLCAGGIMPPGEDWLRKLGLDPGEVPAVEVREAHVILEDTCLAIHNEPYVFRVVRREAFDAWLAAAARERGLALQEGTWVRRVRCLENVVEVETERGTYCARVVVGADGANGVVRRAIARNHPSPVSRLLEVLVPVEQHGSPSLNNKAVLDFSCMTNGVQGYVWDFPTQDRYRPVRTRGVFDSRVHSRSGRLSLRTVIQEELARQGIELGHYELKAHPVRCFHPRGLFSAPRVLLVGDAAGVDALVGEGISFALGYGEVAATELRDAFARGDFSFECYPDRVLAHPIGRSLQRRAKVARLVYRIRSRPLLRFLGRRLQRLMVRPRRPPHTSEQVGPAAIPAMSKQEKSRAT
jgi:flavin-dependent dehydrogenase